MPFALLRGIITWITGRDPIVERRRRQLAREQADGQARYDALEREVYDHLGSSPDMRPPSRDRPTPTDPAP